MIIENNISSLIVSPHNNLEIKYNNFSEYLAEDNNENNNSCIIKNQSKSISTIDLSNIKKTIKKEAFKRKKDLKNY